MSLLVDDSAADWIFSMGDKTGLNTSEAGWNQAADDSVSDGDIFFNSTCLWTNRAGATASLVFQGIEIYLYSAKLPQGGRMNVTCDWNSTAVPLYESELQAGEMVWHATGLDPTIMHVLKVESINGGLINIDKVGVTPGPQSALPPAIPSPVPPAFPNVRVLSTLPTAATSASTATMTKTMTITMTMTASAIPNNSSSDVDLSKGVLAGIVGGTTFAVVILCIITFALCRRRGRHCTQAGNPGAPYTGLRRLWLPRSHSRRGKLRSWHSKVDFIQIEDAEKAETGMEEYGEEKAKAGLLPSIKRLSTLSSFGQSSTSRSPTPSRSLLAQFPQPPLPRSSSPFKSHRPDRSVKLTLSINTDVDSVRENMYVRSSRGATCSRDEAVRSVLTRQHTLSGFSTSDITEEWQEVNFNDEAKRSNGMDDAQFYAEHFSYTTQTEHTEAGTDGRHRLEGAVYINEPDDVSPDTPLLPHSPAVTSSNVSLYHHSSAQSHGPRLSRGNKILRSLYSRSSRHSSLRHSAGKASRHSSLARTLDIRTPVSKGSIGTTSSDSPRSERRNRILSGLTIPNSPLQAADPFAHIEDVPPLPTMPDGAQPASPVVPPSAWMGIVAPSSRRANSKMLRTHRPTGPRPRSFSNASTASKASSGGDSTHSRTPSLIEKDNLLGVVEEGSGSGSLLSSTERRRDVESNDFLSG